MDPKLRRGLVAGVRVLTCQRPTAGTDLELCEVDEQVPRLDLVPALLGLAHDRLEQRACLRQPVQVRHSRSPRICAGL